MKQLLFFQSPLDSYSGYGAHARDIAAALLTLEDYDVCLLYTSPSPRDRTRSRMPSSA